MNEPTITVNGVELNVGQAMTLRVALSHYVSEMTIPDALGDDEAGRTIQAGYRRCGSEVLQLMLEKK